jgi:anti-sigma factor RsiW
MKACWTEGELRAYLDRELPAAGREAVAAHLAECGECDLRYREIAARADRVTAALGALAQGIAPGGRKTAARRLRVWPRWTAAVGIAAGLAVLLIRPAVKPPAPAVALEKVAIEKGDFKALDNEPIDAGLVVRVSLGPNNVQADVIISADGRARAYRLVNNPATD